MFELFNRHKRKFQKKALQDIKRIARVLIIDDRPSDLLKPLEKEGWRVTQIRDVDRIDATPLHDAHILCVDILGVGKKMSFPNEGLGLVSAIRNEYPGKRILLYSSVSTHNLFDEAVDLADRRLLREGQPYPFICAVQELAELAFDWSACVQDVYNRIRDELPEGMTVTQFDKRLRKCLTRDGKLDPEKIAKQVLIGVKCAKIVQGIMSLVN